MLKNNQAPVSILHRIGWLFTSIWMVSACQTNDPHPTSLISADIRDSVYYWSKEIYLWTSKIPDHASFNPLSYASPNAVIEQIRTYSPLTLKGQHEDRFSFVAPKTYWDQLESGTESDLGLGYKFASPTDLRVAYVYAQSPAGQQGVKRGWKIVRVNNIEATISNADALNQVLAGSQASFLFQKPDGTQQTLTLSNASFQTNPVLHHSILTTNNKKVGYMVFNTFLGNTAIPELQAAFNNFRNQAIDELIIDLRYNGGGSTDIMETFANLITPVPAAGKVMYQMQWNERYATTLNRTIRFTSTPSGLNLQRVVFITSRRTASASELLIHSLRPYTNTVLIGDTTVGKPVGYPVIPIIMNQNDPAQNYVVAAVAFKNVNANNFGDYFDGIAVDKVVADDLTKDFGDPNEACLSEALHYFDTGTLRVGITHPSARTGETNDASLRRANQQLDQGPKGLFYPVREGALSSPQASVQ